MARPARTGQGDQVRGQPSRRRDQHVTRLQRAQSRRTRRAAICAESRRRGRGILREHRNVALLVPGRLSGRDRRGRAERVRPARIFLEREPFRPGSRAGGQRARPGPRQQVLGRERHQSGLRADGWCGGTGQVQVPAPDRGPGPERDYRVDHAPAEGRLRRPRRFRHRGCGGRAADGWRPGPAGPGGHDAIRQGSGRRELRQRPERSVGLSRAAQGPGKTPGVPGHRGRRPAAGDRFALAAGRWQAGQEVRAVRDIS